MSVHLVGGGRDLARASEVYGRFVLQARDRALSRDRASARIGVVVVGAAADHAAAVDWFLQALEPCGAVEILAATAEEMVSGQLRAGVGGAAPGSAALDGAWFAGLDGLLVGGGLTPAYHRVLQPHAEAIRAAVADGLPYAGFSAGASIAATRALVGGWLLGQVAVTHEDNAEDLEQVSVVDGLGLVAPTVEVHTAQWGTLSRLVAVVGAAATFGIAIDENTVVILDPATDSSAADQPPPPLEVHGAGQAWLVSFAGGSVRVDRRPAG